MANFKQIAADAGFKGRFSRAASFGWFVREATGVTIKHVLTTSSGRYVGTPNYPGLIDGKPRPYPAQFATTEWGVGSNEEVGFVVKEATNNSEIFVFFNTDEELEKVRQSFISNGKMTSRKRIKEFKLGKAWKT